ncbi:hypothetical protein ACQKH8_14620 [Staphylococcus aureus]
MTGFSVYLGQPLDEAYIKRMIKQGYQMIFTDSILDIDSQNIDNHDLLEI